MVLSAAVTENRFTEKFKQSIAGAANPWLKGLREEAFRFFSETGFPTPKNEEWKYTNIAPIGRADFEVGPSEGLINVTSTLDESAASRIVLVDGRVNRELSTYPVMTFDEALQTPDLSAVLKKNFNEAVDYTKNGFTALNAAFLEEGIFVSLPKDTKAPHRSIFCLFPRWRASFPRYSLRRARQPGDHYRNLRGRGGWRLVHRFRGRDSARGRRPPDPLPRSKGEPG